MAFLALFIYLKPHIKIKDQKFNIEDRGEIEVKGKGMMHTYILKKDADTEFDRDYIHKK